MENSLERLEQIMKPYFDKQNEIESLLDANENEASQIKEEIANLRSKRREERIKLELRLERLRENKDREIEEYVSSQPSFYAGYAATVRKDLEQAYKAQEDELIAEIKSFDATTEKQILNLENSINSQPNRNYFVDMTDAKDLLNNLSTDNKKLKEINARPNYKKVYLREMIDVKNSLRKSLIAEQKEISYAIQKEKINFDSIMLELSNFKYQYNDQHQVTNGSDWKALYEKSNQISSKINELRNSLKVVEEYLNLTELTKEETAAAMSSLAPWEKAEYDRRNSIIDSHDIELPPLPLPNPEDNEKGKPEDDTAPSDSNEEELEGFIDSYTPVEAEFDVQEDEGKTNIVVDNLDELCRLIYKEVLSIAENMQSIKLDPSSNPELKNKYYFSAKDSKDADYYVDGDLSLPGNDEFKLPNGEYINSNDINEAIKKYYEKNKGQKFIIKSENKSVTISKREIKKLKTALKKCSTVKLIQDKKINELDVKRVYVKGRYGDFKDIGSVSTPVTAGDYISRDELIVEFGNIFTSKEKILNLLKKLQSKIHFLKRHKEELPEPAIDTELYDELIKEQEEKIEKQNENLTNQQNQPYINTFDSFGESAREFDQQSNENLFEEAPAKQR